METNKVTASGFNIPQPPNIVHKKLFAAEGTKLLTREDVKKMSTTSLKMELERRGVSSRGKKSALKKNLIALLKECTVSEFESFAMEDASKLIRIKQEEKGSAYVCGNKTWFLSPIPLLKGEVPLVCSAGKNKVVLVTKEKIVYEYIPSTSLVSKIESLNGERVITSSTSATHSCALTLDGDIFSWGNNHYGQLGKNPDQLKQVGSSRPFLCKYFGDQKLFTVIGAALGQNQTLILAKKQAGVDVFSFGQNFKKTGHIPVKVLFPCFKTKICKVYAGNLHFGAIDEHGIAYTWGNGNSGKLGHGDYSAQLTPRKLIKLNFWVKAKRTFNVIDITEKAISCIDMALGQQHSIFLYSLPPLYNCGEVFSCGTGVYGQLALGQEIQSLIPKLSKDLYLLNRLYTKLETSSSHAVVLTTQGELISWGQNTLGQLGRKSIERVGFISGVDTRVGRVGRGPVLDFCCSDSVTLVCMGPYHGLSEEQEKDHAKQQALNQIVDAK